MSPSLIPTGVFACCVISCAILTQLATTRPVRWRHQTLFVIRVFFRRQSLSPGHTVRQIECKAATLCQYYVCNKLCVLMYCRLGLHFVKKKTKKKKRKKKKKKKKREKKIEVPNFVTKCLINY